MANRYKVGLGAVLGLAVALLSGCGFVTVEVRKGNKQPDQNAPPTYAAQSRQAPPPVAGSPQSASSGGNWNYDEPLMEWESKLPQDQAQLDAAVYDDSGSEEMAVKQVAVREVMIQYIEVLSGQNRRELFENQSSARALRALELMQYIAHSDWGPDVLPQAQQLAHDPDFQTRVLKQLVPIAYHQRYYASDHFTELRRISSAESSPTAVGTRQALEAEKAPGLERSVLGLTLGEPLRFTRLSTRTSVWWSRYLQSARTDGPPG